MPCSSKELAYIGEQDEKQDEDGCSQQHDLVCPPLSGVWTVGSHLRSISHLSFFCLSENPVICKSKEEEGYPYKEWFVGE